MVRGIAAIAVAAVLAVTVAAGSPAELLRPSLYTPTPIGYMLSECVHRIPSGSHVSHEHDRATGEPTGRVIVRHAESGSVIRIVPKCDTSANPLLYHGHRYGRAEAPQPASRSLLQFPSDYDGWEAYTVSNYAPGYDVMTNLFNVPAEPVNYPDILYLFPGLQNVNWIPKVDPEPATFDIIQPVLQYPGDTGSGWSVKSWYVTLSAGYLVSDEIVVNPGDIIFGNQTRLSSTTFVVNSTVTQGVNAGQSTDIIAQASWLQSQPWAYITLECYGCQDCTTYPNTSALFTDIKLLSGGKPVAASWSVTPQPPEQKWCQEKAVVNSAASVTINFQ